MFQRGLREQRGPVTTRRIKAGTVLALLVFVAAPLLVLQHTSIRAFHLSPSTTTSPSVVDEFDWYSLEPKETIEWTPCYSTQVCARLLVPLDYSTPNSPTAAIALRMLPATDKANYRGTILMNPGGPGASGTYFVGRVGPGISRIVGPSFDVLGFDPRGVGWSTPLGECFDTLSQRAIWMTQEGDRLLNASDPAAVGLFRARAKLIAERCEARIGGEWGIGHHMNTENVVRDMLKITQKLGQEKLQYWGFSYGSILGQYFAAMYPDKVERLVIDGIGDAEMMYRTGMWNTSLVEIDRAVDSLFAYCHQAGPEKCEMYEPTEEKIRERYFRILDAVEQEPIPISHAATPTVITRKALLQQLFLSTAKPTYFFPYVARTVTAIETRDADALAELATLIVPPTECECADGPLLGGHVDTETTFAIACGDADTPSWDPAAYAAHYAALARQSRLMAPLWSNLYLQCTAWRMRARTHYAGPLAAARTAHPLLVVSMRFDPVSPHADAVRVSARFGGAALLVQDSVGHCSPSTPSVCTARHVRAYFEEGVLPAEGTVCAPEELPFGVSAAGAAGVRSAEDEELLGALRSLGEALPVRVGW